jgi:NTE family protein
MIDQSTGSTTINRPIAIVLGAGGIKGWAHVGALKVLHDAAIPIDLIIGASAGALLGPLYAARGDIASTQRQALAFTILDFVGWFLRGLRISPDAGRMAHSLWRAYGRLRFDELTIRFAAVAHDLGTDRPVLIREGLVARAVEASIRPPIVLRPANINGRPLVDGGMQRSVPTDIAYELGAKTVISVNVGPPFRIPPRLRPTTIQAGRIARQGAGRPDDLASQIASVAELLTQDRSPARSPAVEIKPDMTGITAFSPWHAGQAVRRGEAAARAALPAIRSVLSSTASI